MIVWGKSELHTSVDVMLIWIGHLSEIRLQGH